ncbi:HU family DNA-binding protein [Alphaproteobacteria bacterium]|nr:HU family DNA-binding protein [Alphaproteobacteria bacterium]
MQNKITRNNIAKKISEEFGIPYTLAYKKIDKIILSMSESLEDNLSISSLGSFFLKEKKSRIGRNPKSKEEFVISSRKVISFKKSKKLIL